MEISKNSTYMLGKINEDQMKMSLLFDFSLQVSKIKNNQKHKIENLSKISTWYSRDQKVINEGEFYTLLHTAN